MSNIEPSVAPQRVVQRQRAYHPVGRRLALVFLVFFGAATACSLQDIDYLSASLESAEAGSVACQAAGGKDGRGGRSGVAGIGSAGTPSGFAGHSEVGGATNGSGGQPSSTTTGSGSGGQNPSAPVGPFGFDSAADLSGWRSDLDGVTPTFAGEGSSAPLGAMQVQTNTTSVHVVRDLSGTDLAGFAMVARVRSPTFGASVKPFAMSSGWIWADGGVQLIDVEWCYVSIDFSLPSYETAGYDAKQIIVIGFEFSAGATFLIDEIWLE